MRSLHLLFWMVISSVLALASILTLLPFMALSTYGFLLDGDIVIYLTVLEQGVSGLFSFFYTHVMGRYSIILIHGSITELFQILGVNPWHWNGGMATLYYLAQVGSLVWLYRTVFPTLRWSFAIALATMPLAALITVINDKQALWPGAMYIYALSFALYVFFIVLFIRFYDKRGFGLASSIVLCVVFFFYVGTHELSVIPMGFFLIFVAALALDYRSSGQPFSVIFPFSKIRIGVSLRPSFDNLAFILTVCALGILLCVSAWLQITSPSVAARAGYWPAAMTVWEAFFRALPVFLTLVERFFDLSRPYFIVIFLLVFFVARTVPLRPSLMGRGRYLILVPVVVFVVLAYVGVMTSLIMLGRPIPRVEHYMLSYGYVAFACLAIFLAVTLPKRWISARWASVAALVTVAQLGSVFWNDPGYRGAVDEATGPGFDFSRRVAERTRIMERAKGGTAYIRELERPTHWVQGIIHGPNTEQAFQAAIARGFGVKKVVFMPCGGSIDPLWCHYRFNPLDGGAPEIMPPHQYLGPGIKIQEKRMLKAKEAKEAKQ